jgi:hypothetical protein
MRFVYFQFFFFLTPTSILISESFFLKSTIHMRASSWAVGVGRRRKEKDLMVDQIGFLWCGYGWLGLYKTGWLGSGGDIDDGYGYFRSKQTTVSTWVVWGNISKG